MTLIMFGICFAQITVEHLNEVWIWEELLDKTQRLRATDVFCESLWSRLTYKEEPINSFIEVKGQIYRVEDLSLYMFVLIINAVEGRLLFVQPTFYDRDEASLNIVELTPDDFKVLSNVTVWCKFGDGVTLFAQNRGQHRYTITHGTLTITKYTSTEGLFVNQ
jgi:hypothetical protein